MGVVVIGASGNIGTSVVEALVGEPDIGSVLGIARRPARDWSPKLGDWSPKLEWRSRDVRRDDLRADLQGADAVVCLAWAIQPSREAQLLRQTKRRRLAPGVRGRG